MAVANHISTSARSEGMFRRDFMKMQPMLLAALSVPSMARAAMETESPVRSAFVRWHEAYRAVQDASGSASDDEFARLNEDVMRRADAVVRAETRTPGDTIYKIVAYTFFGEFEPGDSPLGHLIYDEAKAWVEAAR